MNRNERRAAMALAIVKTAERMDISARMKPMTLQQKMEAEWAAHAYGIEHCGSELLRSGWAAPGNRTKHAHLLCPCGCGAADKIGAGKADELHPAAVEKHADCAAGCGTHSLTKCGGRYAAAKMGTAGTDAALRVALGKKRAKTIRDRGW
jgi:hypothetical protein